MKIMLINPPSGNRRIARDMAGGLGFSVGGSGILLPPLELAAMAATLSHAGAQVRLLDCDAEGSFAQEAYRQVGDYRPERIVAGVSLPGLKGDCLFVKGLRQYCSGVIAVKTMIACESLLEEILRRSGADMCIWGEADLEIGEILERRQTRGTASPGAGGITKGSDLIVSDLNSVPISGRSFLRNDRYHYPLLGEEPVTTLQTSRGCPFPCAYYCPYPLVQGSVWRPRSPENIVAEIEAVVRCYGITNILFRDATFTLEKERVLLMCRLLIGKKLPVRWWCETRADCLDAPLLRLMKQAGCAGMNIGVETGDESLRQKEAKRGLSAMHLAEIIREARRIDIRLHFLFMIGLPAETKKTIFNTYALLRTVRPESAGFCIATPYPGTPLHELAQQRGWIESDEWSNYDGHHAVMHTDNLSSADVSFAYEKLQRAFMLQKRGLAGILSLRSLERNLETWGKGSG